MTATMIDSTTAHGIRAKARVQSVLGIDIDVIPLDRLTAELASCIGAEDPHRRVREVEEMLTSAGLNARHERVQGLVFGERDLRACPLEVGDTVEVMVDRPNGAGVAKGDLGVIVRADSDTHRFKVPGNDLEWAAERKYLRAVQAAVPQIPAEWQGRDREGAERIVAWMLDGQQHYWASIDEAGNTIDTLWSSTSVASTRQGKDWLGRCLRHKRWVQEAAVAHRLAGEPDPFEPLLRLSTVEEVPERNLAPAEPDPKDVRIQTLEDQSRSLREQRDQRTRFHYDDIQMIGERLIREAENRGWCDDFDAIVEELNAGLHVELPTREKDVEVEVSGYVRVPFSYSITVRVPANADNSEIEEAASEEMSSVSASDTNLDTWSAEFDDSEFDFEF